MLLIRIYFPAQFRMLKFLFNGFYHIVNLLAGLGDSGVILSESVFDLFEDVVDGMFHRLVEKVGQEGYDLY
jgi:hypothetical protein